MVLASAGGGLGILFAYWGTDLLIAASPANIPLLSEAGLDGSVVLFTAGLSIGTGLVFGLIPALQSTGLDLNEALKDSARGSTRASGRMRSALVVAEVAFAMALLVGAGLLIKRFWQVQNLNPGCDPKNVLAVSMTLPQNTYPDADSQRSFYNQVLPKITGIPGVISGGTTTPLLGGWQNSFVVGGRPRPNPGEFKSADIARISPDFFSTMNIPLVKGRHFHAFDHQDGNQVIIIDERFAESEFPNEEPLGKQLGFGPADNTTWREIVGVVGHVKNYGV